MKEWMIALGMAHVCSLLAVLMIPSWLLRRDERREGAGRKSGE
jgi:hypothetical protein